MEIHEKIRQARVASGLTAKELAEKIGVGRSTYQYWEEKTPSMANIRKVELALNLQPGTLTGNSSSVPVKVNLADVSLLATIENSAMLRVILGLLAEMESVRRGELISSVFARIERAVEDEMEAKKQELLQSKSAAS